MTPTSSTTPSWRQSHYALKALKFEGKVTSWTAINEVVYTLFRKMAEKRASGRYTPSKKCRKTCGRNYLTGPTCDREVSSGEGITSIPELQNEYVAHQISLECGLLPADAMILATALSHGINKIATLDRNFEAVKGLTTLLPREYWEV